MCTDTVQMASRARYSVTGRVDGATATPLTDSEFPLIEELPNHTDSSHVTPVICTSAESGVKTNCQLDAAGGGVFHGVAQDVAEHLVQARFVADQGIGDFGSEPEGEGEAFRVRGRA